MHELGLIVEVVEIVERAARENKIDRVDKVVLDIGEMYYVVPALMRSVYRSAIKGTVLEGSELEINFIPATSKCRKCGTVFNPLEADGICPACGAEDYEVTGGKEFEIRQIGFAPSKPPGDGSDNTNPPQT